MITETLISKQGPLGYVWLAANYDKKLTKHQLLSANISDSTEFIVNSSINYSNSESSPQENTNGSSETNGNTITLRLSGQLLLGIVRIYSRKTKYLLDDVNDILIKLKTSFKYASGINLGIDGGSINSNQINLNLKDTIVSNVKSITLQDQVTQFDLLYQEDLNLDDDNNMVVNRPSQSIGDIFSQALSQSRQPEDDSFDFDNSIEYGRYGEPLEPTTPGGHEIDLQLDFDLNDDYGDDFNNNDNDDSIEVGRNASHILDERELSTLSIDNNNNKDDNDDGFDLGNPLETIDEPGLEVDDGSSTPIEHISTPPPIEKQPRQKRTGITADGEIITNKRKLKIDSLEDLDGISIQTLKDNQERLLQTRFENDQYLTLNLTESEKLSLIYELSAPPITNKRRKLFNVDEQLQQRCLELSKLEEQKLEEQHNLGFNDDDYGDDFNNNDDDNDNFNQSLDFDISLPEFSNENVSDLIDSQENEDDGSNINSVQSTIQVAENIRQLLKDESLVELSDIIEEDLTIQDNDDSKVPLGLISKSGERQINMKREATKCFFELLVLATNDCIEMQQENDSIKLGQQINIRSRDRLYQNFL
ncbi:Rec8 like protein-domain-containing protein [Scheffersomyces coipomensis]|uniref:Rec8 like protein-domain-containing protein n=1 Tax=Scheffersomyces coipomensis TaxID=1788519 RepID=UPI00315C80A0